MAAAAIADSATKLDVEGCAFPALVTPPGSSKTHFLGGFVAFTAIGIYLESDAISALAKKWQGKAAEELNGSLEFFRDIAGGHFEKSTRVVMIVPLTGEQYSEKVCENCVTIWKEMGIYTGAEDEALKKFKEALESETFLPGSSILFTHSPAGSLTIAFSKDGSITEAAAAVIDNGVLTRALLESIIGENGVSPAAKQSLALRLSELMAKVSDALGRTQPQQQVEETVLA
uniref:Chalcone-flavonone isomerase family protein n=1 Tax=Dracaena cambodiana TaxID=580341 RepID=A0A8A5KCB7_9ASPA|nr:chalcone isomerase [Dracaena cambodiana]